jgi:hypothetical protein
MIVGLGRAKLLGLDLLSDVFIGSLLEVEILMAGKLLVYTKGGLQLLVGLLRSCGIYYRAYQVPHAL